MFNIINFFLEENHALRPHAGRRDYGGSAADKEFDDCRIGPFQQGYTVCQQTLFVDYYCGH